jgi:hypothetical protein
MKLDAHCALDKDFDTKLLAEFEPDWTVVPRQFNLHVFDWKCKQCGERTYQSPKPVKCPQCGSQFHKQVIVWHPTDGTGKERGVSKGGWKNVATDFWRFDSNLEFQYGYPTQGVKPPSGDIVETMSLLGACWAMRRERYWEIEGNDELYGSWGQQGTEIALKTWLSGGRLVTNRRVGGIGFPYPGGGHKGMAMARCREVWLQNKWPKQMYPLSWLLDRFKPVRDWHLVNGNPTLSEVQAAGLAFGPPRLQAGLTLSQLSPAEKPRLGQDMPIETVGLKSVESGGTEATLKVDSVGNQFQMQRIGAVSVAAKVIKDGNVPTTASWNRLNQPCVDDPMDQMFATGVANPTVAPVVASCPDPAARIQVNSDSGEDSSDVLDVQENSEILQVSHDSASIAELGSGLESRNHRGPGPSIGLLYYTCGLDNHLLESASRNTLISAKNGYELGCVSLERTDFGDWNIVVNAERGPLTMHRQILAGLERLKADVVFFCEHDVLYHPSHFDFTPPRKDTFYYNVNVWRVRASDGHAVKTTDCKQLSGLCCWRETAIEHYRKRVERIEREGFSRKNGYEPGTRHLPNGYDDSRADSWVSAFPNLDIRHGGTATGNHWTPESFRNQKYAAGWEETDGVIPGWPKVAGRVEEVLKELASE